MIERKYLMHFLGTPFNGNVTDYHRIGKDLEEFNEELNPDVEVKKNIWGEQSISHKGYEIQRDVDPYYAEEDDPFYEELEAIVNGRKTGDDCKTVCIDVLVDSTGTVVWAYKEDVYVIPTSRGGDTSGYQIPYTIYSAGNRSDVTSKASISGNTLTLST